MVQSDDSGDDSSNSDSLCPRVAYVPSERRESRDSTRPGREPASRTDKPPTGSERPRRPFIDYVKLMSMKDNADARQAWPGDAKCLTICPEFLTRPIDKASGIWAEDSCKHCFYYLKQKADHPPLKCRKFREFLESKPSLKEVLVPDLPPLPPRQGFPVAEGGSDKRSGGGHSKQKENTKNSNSRAGPAKSRVMALSTDPPSE